MSSKQKKADGVCLDLFRKRSSYEAVFCVLLIGAACYSIYLYISSYGQLQGTRFFRTTSNGEDTFHDFFNVLKYVSDRDPYHYKYPEFRSETAYPPLAYLILYPFSRIASALNLTTQEMLDSQIGLMALFGFVLISIVPLAILLYQKKEGSILVKASVLLTLFSSGIFVFSVERGNTILLTASFLAAFLLGYRSENRFVREMSYVALACAAGLKVYPAVFGILLLKEKRFADAVRTALYGAAAFFLPFFYFTGGLSSFPTILENVSLNAEAYKLQVPTFRFGFLPFYLSCDPAQLQADTWITVGNIVFALAVLASFFLKSHWKTAMLLACAIVAVPVNSAYYTGLYLFVPIVLFLNEEKHPLFDWGYLLLILFILNPFQIVGQDMILYTGRIANIALLLLLISILCEGVIRAILWGRSRLDTRLRVRSQNPI
jgi:hypothetical protein